MYYSVTLWKLRQLKENCPSCIPRHLLPASSITQIKSSRTNSDQLEHCFLIWCWCLFVWRNEDKALENVNMQIYCKHEIECNNITYLYCICIHWKYIQRRELRCQMIYRIGVFHYLFRTNQKEYLSIGAWQLQNSRCKKNRDVRKELIIS